MVNSQSLKAVFFGSIGTLIETSDIQREAFNQAFEEAGLNWDWDPSTYRDLLEKSGGEQRIRDYAETKGDDVDAAALHARKSEIFQERLSAGLPLRQDVTAVIKAVKARGLKLGFVTTTSAENVHAVLAATHGTLTKSDFDFVGARVDQIAPKPAPDIYEQALEDLALKPSEVIAIEDTPVSARSAMDAGIATIAFPGAFAQGDFGDVLVKLDRISPADLGLDEDEKIAS